MKNTNKFYLYFIAYEGAYMTDSNFKDCDVIVMYCYKQTPKTLYWYNRREQHNEICLYDIWEETKTTKNYTFSQKLFEVSKEDYERALSQKYQYMGKDESLNFINELNLKYSNLKVS